MKTNENLEEPSSRTWILKLKIEDKVLIAILIAALSIGTSIVFGIFYTPKWAMEVVKTNKQVLSKINNESLVLIGGGTVHEYFNDIEILDKYYEYNDTASLIIVRVPSLAACKTLKDNERKSVNGWIVLSSTKANSDDFMESNEVAKFKEKKRIIEFFLKEDKLLVITSKDTLFNKISQNNVITVQELKDIIYQTNKDDFDIYITSQGSGTLKLYKDAIGQEFVNFKNVENFDLNTNYSENRPHIILCSDIYKPQNYENCNTYNLVTPDNKFINKELYLYFTANVNNNNTLTTPSNVDKFIQLSDKNFCISKVKITQDLIISAKSKNN